MLWPLVFCDAGLCVGFNRSVYTGTQCNIMEAQNPRICVCVSSFYVWYEFAINKSV
jgi:hypothetical protein